MTAAGPGGSPATNDRRAAAQAKASEMRVKQRRRETRNKVLLQGGIGVAVLAIVAVVFFVVTSSVRPASPGPENMASDGIVIGEGLQALQTDAIPADGEPTPTQTDGDAPNIRIYLDYLCPICRQFEEANGELIREWVDSGAATVEYHPIAILTNRSAGTKYSLRAANAAACVADSSPDSFFDVNAALFESQPAEGSEGLTDAELIDLVQGVGVADDDAVASCIEDGTFSPWVETATDRATGGGVQDAGIEAITGTPTILVNGRQYTGSIVSPGELSQFVLSTTSQEYTESSPSPSPSGEPEDGEQPEDEPAQDEPAQDEPAEDEPAE